MPFRSSSWAALIVIAVLIITGQAAAQCSKKIADLPVAPELLGFRLGMTKEQVKAHVPQTEFGKMDDFGVSKTTINPYFDPKIDKTKFEGVRSISLDLLDQRLTSVWIGYDENFNAKNVDEFVKLISQSMQLQSTDWSSYRSRGRQMRCADFQLIVTMVAGGPSLRIVDVGAEDTVATRRAAKEEEASAAETAATTNGETSEVAEPEIIADKKSKTYYVGACRPEKEIAETDKITFKTTDEAVKAGFKLAKNCH